MSVIYILIIIYSIMNKLIFFISFCTYIQRESEEGKKRWTINKSECALVPNIYMWKEEREYTFVVNDEKQQQQKWNDPTWTRIWTLSSIIF